MKRLFFVLLLAAGPAGAAGFPPSVHHLANCENRWFLKEVETPNVRFLGFAYVDPEAGVTIEYDGEVATSDDGVLVRKPGPLENKARVIIRAAANIEIACLSDDEAASLGLPRTPEWLELYKDKGDPGPHNVAWASFYNEIGAYEKALELLQQASTAGFTSVGLMFERGFALNATGRYSDAAAVLETVATQNSDDSQVIGELAFSYLSLRNYKRAVELYTTALSKDRERKTGRRAEFAQNLSVACTGLGDAKSASKWRAKAEKWKHELGPDAQKMKIR